LQDTDALLLGAFPPHRGVGKKKPLSYTARLWFSHRPMMMNVLFALRATAALPARFLRSSPANSGTGIILPRRSGKFVNFRGCACPAPREAAL
jgi:hypothetical protein